MNEKKRMKPHPMRIVYFGTPEYASPALQTLADDERFEVCLVVTQPDRPVGRKKVLAAPPVKTKALELGIPVYQPDTLRRTENRTRLVEESADLFVVAAYGMILGRKSLAIPRMGAINLHASLLPRFRGASPVSAAIACGDEETGITLMQMDLGIDTGPIISSLPCPVMPDDTTESLTLRLAERAAQMLARDLEAFLDGELVPRPQPNVGVSVTRMLTKNDGWIDWEWEAERVERHVRAMWSWPRAWTTCGEKRVQIHEARLSSLAGNNEPGALIVVDNKVCVTCADRLLELITVQMEGGRAMLATQWLAGLPDTNIKLGITSAPPEMPDRIVGIGELAI